VLVLEDPGGEPLERLLGAPLETGRFLRLATDITVALGKLIARLAAQGCKARPYHGELRGGQVRLTGFGIASRVRVSDRSPSRRRLSPVHSLTWRPNKPDG